MFRFTSCSARTFLNGISKGALRIEGLVTTETPFSLACAKMKEQQNRDEASERKEAGSPVQSSIQVHACHHVRSSTAAARGVTGKHSVCKAVAKRKDSVPLVLYRRPLPESCIAFASEEGKKIFIEALISGHMNCYFRLASQFRTQDEPAYCGLSTLIMVLNAMEIDPGRVWKGPWKWYHEDMLDCCIPTELIRKQGITFDEFICLAGCNLLETKAARVDDSSSEEEFRELVKDVTLKEDTFLILSYSRPALGQTGDGHFAPVSGYHPQRDLVLILDTARFKYPPHWISLPLLFMSMKALDMSTGLPRGHIQVWPAKDSKALLLFKIVKQFSVNASPAILENYQHFLAAWTELLNRPCSKDGVDVLPAVVDSTLHGLVEVACLLNKETFVLTTQEHILCTDTCNVQCVIEELLLQLEATNVFKNVYKVVTKLSQEDLSKLENLFGTWPSVGATAKADDQPLPLKGTADCKSLCCDMNQSLCLCHFVTAFLLSWPYSLPPTPGTLGAVLHDLSMQAHSGTYGQLVKEELFTLHRQLRKLTGYHSPANQSPAAASVEPFRFVKDSSKEESRSEQK